MLQIELNDFLLNSRHAPKSLSLIILFRVMIEKVAWAKKALKTSMHHGSRNNVVHEIQGMGNEQTSHLGPALFSCHLYVILPC